MVNYAPPERGAGPGSPVRRSAALWLLVPLLLPLLLPGCAFFTSSLFPGFLAQAEASSDLGPKIDLFLSGKDYTWYSQLFVLRSAAGSDYGAVLIEINNLPAKLLLLVDPQSAIYDKSTTPESDPPDDELGRLHLTDAGGWLVVGNVRFNPADLKTTEIKSPITNRNGLGFASGSYNYVLWSVDVASNQVQWQSHLSDWAANASGSLAIAKDQYGYDQYGFELRGIYFDPGAAGREVILVFHNYEQNGRIYVFFLPASGFSGSVSLSTPLGTYYPPLELDEKDVMDVIYTRKGLVVAGYNERATLKDFSGNDTGKRLDLGHRGEVRVGFDLEGDNFWAFNPEDRMLYRGKTGW